METAIKGHDLDIETLILSDLPLEAGAQIGDSASQQLAGSSQQVGAAKESKSGNENGTPETFSTTGAPTDPGSDEQDMYQGYADHLSGGVVKAHGVSPNRIQFDNSSFDRSAEVFHATPSGNHYAGKRTAGKTLHHGGSSVGSFLGSHSDLNMLRPIASRGIIGKSLVSMVSPSKEQLKELRAQCLVFLAFRNGLVPKKLHLEIALGNIYSKEDGTRGDHEQLVHDPSSVAEVPMSFEGPDSSKGHSYVESKDSDLAKFPDQLKMCNTGNA